MQTTYTIAGKQVTQATISARLYALRNIKTSTGCDREIHYSAQVAINKMDDGSMCNAISLLDSLRGELAAINA